MVPSEGWYQSWLLVNASDDRTGFNSFWLGACAATEESPPHPSMCLCTISLNSISKCPQLTGAQSTFPEICQPLKQEGGE